MQAEHAHLDLNYGAHSQPRVGHEHHIKEVAHAALKNIPGARELVNKTFDKGAWKKPFTLPAKRHVNQAMHLGFS